MKYIEQDCTVEHEGRTFESGGAVVSEDYAVAYMTGDMRGVTDWHGKPLGEAHIGSSWPTPRSYVSSRMYQVYFRIGGVWYTGRTAGGSMIVKGRRTARQPS